MKDHCTACADRCRWMVRTIVKLKHFFNKKGLVQLYKAHVLPRLEAHTAAVYHATPTVLKKLDGVQRLFLRELELSEAEALSEYTLAPLRVRRDLAMLGLLHSCALGTAPPQLLDLFPRTDRGNSGVVTRLQVRRHNKQLADRRAGTRTETLRRSVFGLVAVYNLLPPGCVSKDTKHLKGYLQNWLRELSEGGCNCWAEVLGRRGISLLQGLRLRE